MNVLAAALDYARRGWPVFPCNPSTKAPYTRNGFKDATFDETEIQNWWGRWPKAMIGVPTGAASGVWAVDVDLPEKPGEPDGGAALAELEEQFGKLPSTHTHVTPSGGYHLLFKWDPKRRIGLRTGSLPAGIDVRGDGGYIIVPPSRRSDGKEYQHAESLDFFRFAQAPAWLYAAIEQKAPTDGAGAEARAEQEVTPNEGSAANATNRTASDKSNRLHAYVAAALEDEARTVASAQPGSRNTTLNRAAFRLGQLAAHGLLTLDEIEARLFAAANHCGLLKDDGAVRVQATIRSGVKGGMARPRDLSELDPHGEPAGDDDPPCSVNGGSGGMPPEQPEAPLDNQPEGDGVPGGDPEPWTFDPWAERPAPAFPLDALPKEVREWVEDRAAITGADPTGLAMSALACLSAALSHAVRLKLKQYDDWFIGPLLWVMLVGDVSAMKTPIIRAASAPLRQLSAEADKRREAEIIRQLGADAFTRKLTPEDKKILDGIPAAREFIINDVTVEALSDLLKQQDTGIIMVRDEVLGWIAQLERYAANGKGAGYDRACWLEAYNSGPYSIRRVIRGAVHVRRWSSSILGGVQPERLRDAGNLAVDGLLARFVPVMIRKGGPDLDIPRDAAVRNNYTELFVRLARATETVVFLSPKARQVREQLAADLRIMSQSPEPHFAAYVGKLPGLWGAVALILHMAELVGGRANASDAVSGETALRASRIVDYCLDSGRVFYDWLADPTGEEAQRIAAVILKQETGEIDLRTFRQHKLAFAAEGPAAANKALELFVTGGWLTPKRPGPDNRHWTITPRLRERYREPFAAYQARAAEIRQRIEEAASRRRDRDASGPDC